MWARIPDAVDRIERETSRFVQDLFGEVPLAARRSALEIRPAQGRAYAVTGDESTLHVDQHPCLSPAYQVLVCVRPAADGGESTLLDTWPIFERIASSELLGELCTVARAIRFNDTVWFGPTLSYRAGAIAVVHNSNAGQRDPIGAAVQQLIESQPRVQLKLEPGDVLINSNYRWLHGRTAFRDAGRKLWRVLVWSSSARESPFDALALPRARAVEQAAAAYPRWIRRRLGLSGEGVEAYTHEDVMAHYTARESPEELRELTRAFEEVHASLGLPIAACAI